MPKVGFEPTIPMFERAKTFYAFDRVANVIAYYFLIFIIYQYSLFSIS
jgi:hypothetical protein